MNTKPYVTLCVWPSKGLRAYGPFRSKTEALSLGDKMLFGYEWWVQEVQESVEMSGHEWQRVLDPERKERGIVQGEWT